MRARLDRLMAEARVGRKQRTESLHEEARRAVHREHRNKSGPTSAHDAPPADATPIHYRRDLPRSHAAPCPSPLPAGDALSLDIAELTDGSPYAVKPHGDIWLVETDVSDFPHSPDLLRRIQNAIATPPQHLSQRLGCLPLPTDAPSAADILFMDIESTGLSNSPLFLIGVMLIEQTPAATTPQRLVVKQYFARNYAEEAAVVAAFAHDHATHPLLVTFNGKSYDIPFIRARAAVNTVKLPPPGAHFDLLHESRRLWKTKLPNCKLQTLEHHICGHAPRLDDIPGSEIPDAYHTYVRTSNAYQMASVLKHNMLDLITLADIITHFE